MAQQVSLVFLGAAFLAYLQGTVMYQLLLLLRRPRFGRWATLGLLIGISAQGVGLIIRWLGAGGIPFGAAAADTLALYVWLTVAVCVVLERTMGQKALGAIVAPLACLGLLAVMLAPREEATALAPFARSLWLPIHVGASFASYASLTVAFGCAVLYLLQERQLKLRRPWGLFVHLPPLGTLELVTYRLIEAGFVLLTVAIVVGAFGSERAWGSYWSWEPKQTATLITWLIYLGYIHLRNVAGWAGKHTARLAVAGFLAVLVTYLVVSLALPGQHDFGLVGRL
jgi:cytochrome c-type biogenesis protein CcsB